MRRIALVAAVSASLAGCAIYHAEPLPPAAALVAQPPQPKMSMDEVGRYALAHSPGLVASRARAEVGVAQADEAGLLPDPQFSASADHPTVHGVGLTNAYALGLAEDLQALLTEPSRAEGAEAKAKQARLELVWAEWQTLQEAARLYAEKVYADDKLAQLQATAEILEQQSQRSMQALKRHNTTIELAGSDLSTALDIASRKDAAARAAVTADADLKALLGLMPTASLQLSDPGDPPVVTRQDMVEALNKVTKRRPDLLALQAGYHAQEEAVWTAILQQFPAINLGFNRASDTTNVQTNGLSVTLSIPIFGSTQARIRTERATRTQLRAEYQSRLDQTVADAWRIWHTLSLLRAQVQELDSSVPKLRDMAQIGRKAYAAGNLSPATYVVLETSLSARESELLDLKATLWNDTIALKTLLAATPLYPGTADGS